MRERYAELVRAGGRIENVVGGCDGGIQLIDAAVVVGFSAHDGTPLPQQRSLCVGDLADNVIHIVALCLLAVECAYDVQRTFADRGYLNRPTLPANGGLAKAHHRAGTLGVARRVRERVVDIGGRQVGGTVGLVRAVACPRERNADALCGQCLRVGGGDGALDNVVLVLPREVVEINLAGQRNAKGDGAFLCGGGSGIGGIAKHLAVRRGRNGGCVGKRLRPMRVVERRRRAGAEPVRGGRGGIGVVGGAPRTAVGGCRAVGGLGASKIVFCAVALNGWHIVGVPVLCVVERIDGGRFYAKRLGLALLRHNRKGDFPARKCPGQPLSAAEVLVTVVGAGGIGGFHGSP